jgi:hypothetical protein
MHAHTSMHDHKHRDCGVPTHESQDFRGPGPHHGRSVSQHEDRSLVQRKPFNKTRRGRVRRRSGGQGFLCHSKASQKVQRRLQLAQDRRYDLPCLCRLGCRLRLWYQVHINHTRRHRHLHGPCPFSFSERPLFPLLNQGWSCRWRLHTYTYTQPHTRT